MHWDYAVEEAKEQLGICGYTEDWDEVLKLAREILRENAQARYRRYLKSEKWQKLRAKALYRDNYKCEDCKQKAECVHHINYDTLYTNKEIDDVISLCNLCHDKKHGIKT